MIIVDGAHMMFRAYYALPPLNNSKGQPTGAIHGMVMMLDSLRRTHPKHRIIVAFDSPGGSFRNEIYPEYKANRGQMPDELGVQIPIIFQIIELLGLPLIRQAGLEADDIIATLATTFAEKGEEVIIASSDKDLAQLVSDSIVMYDAMKKITIDRTGVIKKFGVTPAQIVGYLSLIGDTVDNIPGVPKVGPKTAAKWLNKYSTLENVLQHSNCIQGVVGQSLRENIDNVRANVGLVLLKKDADLGTVENWQQQPCDAAGIHTLFAELEFNNVPQDLLGGSAEQVIARQQTVKYETILTTAALQSWCNKIQQHGVFAFDTETTSLQTQRASIVGFSLAVAAGDACYVPLNQNQGNTNEHSGNVQNGLDAAQAFSVFKETFANPALTCVGQNIKYDLHILANSGIFPSWQIEDTMVLSYIINSTKPHGLDALAQRYLNHTMISYKDVVAKDQTFADVPIAVATQYASEDADITLQVWHALQQEADDKITQVYQQLERPLIQVLFKMERIGVLIDSANLHHQTQQLTARCALLQQHGYTLAGETFNIDSPKQLQHILFDKLGIKVVKKTSKGQPSTNEAVLHQLASEHALPQIILEYRSLAKLVSTYTNKLTDMADADTGRVHTSFQQTVASTGRLSSVEPNLQNIPIKTPEGRRVRTAFIAPEDNLIISADYSQIELRLMAHVSQDAGLIAALQNGGDVHKSTAAEVFNVMISEVDEQQRRAAKAINFGLMYGMSAWGLARQLGVDPAKAQIYIDSYFEKYPAVHEFMQQTRDSAHANGYVETIFGRRLYVPNIHSSNAQIRMGAERAAINGPLQGSAADIIKKAMITIDNELVTAFADTKMVLQVHDELVFETPTIHSEAFQHWLRNKMEHVTVLAVPLVVECGAGTHWGSAH